MPLHVLYNIVNVHLCTRRPWISEHLQELRKKKFNDELDTIPDVSNSHSAAVFVSQVVYYYY